MRTKILPLVSVRSKLHNLLCIISQCVSECQKPVREAPFRPELNISGYIYIYITELYHSWKRNPRGGHFQEKYPPG